MASRISDVTKLYTCTKWRHLLATRGIATSRGRSPTGWPALVTTGPGIRYVKKRGGEIGIGLFARRITALFGLVASDAQHCLTDTYFEGTLQREDKYRSEVGRKAIAGCDASGSLRLWPDSARGKLCKKSEADG